LKRRRRKEKKEEKKKRGAVKKEGGFSPPLFSPPFFFLFFFFLFAPPSSAVPDSHPKVLALPAGDANPKEKTPIKNIIKLHYNKKWSFLLRAPSYLLFF
jgi:hypothetical protein